MRLLRKIYDTRQLEKCNVFVICISHFFVFIISLCPSSCTLPFPHFLSISVKCQNKALHVIIYRWVLLFNKGLNLHLEKEPASDTAEISRAKSDQVRAPFAVSASHMRQGNLTALAQTHTNGTCISHTARQRCALCIFSLVQSCDASSQVRTSYDHM